MDSPGWVTVMPQLEHIGLAVSDPALVEALYQKLFGFRPYKSESVEEQGVRTIFLSADTAKLELLEALTDSSPIAKYLSKRGEGIHHLAFEVEDIHAELVRVRTLGFTPLSEEPRPGADGKLIFFLHPKQTHGVLVEFCQQTEQRLTPEQIPFQGGHLAGYTMGHASAPSLMLLHGGLGSTHLEFVPLMRALQEHFFVMAFDLAGHGASSDFPTPSSLAKLGIAQVEAVMNYYGVSQTALLGFSMGGTIALHTALHLEERLSRLILVGVNTTWDASTIRSAAHRIDPGFITKMAPAWAERLNREHGASRWQTLALQLRNGIEAYAAHTPTPAQLTTLTLPTLVCAGDHDRIYPLDHTLNLYRALPNSQLLIFPNVEYDLRQINPRWFAQALHRFLL